MKKIIIIAAMMLLAFASYATEITVDFEDISITDGNHGIGTEDGYFYFESGTTSFPTFVSYNGMAWTGFSYSNETDMETAGSDNQFSTYNTSGAEGSANFAMAYFMDANPATNTISFAEVGGIYSDELYVCNATYAALSMKNGDYVAKKFGGESGDDPDWFKLTIKGITVEGEYTDPLDFYLADFRFSDNSKDYIIEDWTAVDLSSFEEKLAGIFMTLSSSDNGDWGMNTPAYVAIDNIIYNTEPSSIEDENLMTSTVELQQNYPNPFNPSTSINYKLNAAGKVNIAVFNANGKKIWETGNQMQATGQHNVSFNGANLNSGTYFYSVVLNGKIQQTKKMMLVK